MSDIEKRALGQQSILALQALDAALMARAADTIHQAESAYQAGELSPELAHRLLVALLEQRALRRQLEGQVEEGTRAGQRLAVQDLNAARRAEKERQISTHGRNRFFSRTRVPGPDPAA